MAYDYDSNGNRVARTGADVDQTDFTYDAQDRLLSYRQNADTLVDFTTLPTVNSKAKPSEASPPPRTTTMPWETCGR